MKSLENRDPFKLGVVAIVIGLVLAVGVVVLSSLSFGKSTYTAYLAQSAGLKPKEDVQIAGVLVGAVKSVDLAGVGHCGPGAAANTACVKVTFTVDSSVHLGAQTTADVKVATLLGTHLLSVTPTGGGSLQGGQIPLAQTSVPFNLQDVLNKGAQTLQQIDAKQLATLLNTMTTELTPSTKIVGPALEGIVRLSTVIANRSGQIGDLLKAARSVTTQLSSSSADLIALMQQTNLVIQEVTDRREAIHLLLVETAKLAKNVNGIITDTKADTGPALAALNGTLAELRAQDSQLRKVLDVMGPAARYLANATGNGPYLDLFVCGSIIPPNDAPLSGTAGKC
jgi:phospholipid/cholesterol/gamma-HCH transport system substrate-binding protein